MKKLFALTMICAGLCTLSFAKPSPAPVKKFTFDCTMSGSCGGVTVSASGANCEEAGRKLGAACDKLTQPEVAPE